ncbi:MAG: hypothetical protein DMF61_24080 [Blastocatellia bacterium AA13]|nr:MAG: hypothetical protein DMF61_24080 [Blastocatellia bacterium AA13]
MIRAALTLLVLCVSVAPLFASQQGTGTLKGRIEDEKGKPIAGAEVRVRSVRSGSIKETKTDQSGNYSFDLEADEYSVAFDADGYQGGTMTSMQQVEGGRETKVKTITLSKAKRSSLIRGAVFDTSGVSLGGARVKLVRVPTPEEEKEHKHIRSFSMEKYSNSRGEIAFRLPPARARYRLTATLEGYKPDTKIVDVNESEGVPVSLSMEPLKKR